MSWNRFFRPKLIDCIPEYNLTRFRSDLLAGLIVGLIALPLSIALGIASGLGPREGLITAIVAGFLISALGGSRVQIGGPTAAFVGIVGTIVARHGVENLLICTVMAGIILMVMGAAKMGGVIKFIPYPVTSGFTTGIAVTIFLSQLHFFFGWRIPSMPTDFMEKMRVVIQQMSQVDTTTFLVGVGSLAIIFLWPRSLSKKIPGSIVAVVVATLVVQSFHWNVETVGSRYQDLPQGLPEFHAIHFTWKNLQILVLPALTIALLAGIESLLSAVVADGLTGDRHDSNQELMAQGMANVMSPFFGGIPATGAIARTAANIRNGATSPISGMIHAGILLIIMMVAMPLASRIPLATLSAVLFHVALNMGEWHIFTRVKHLPGSDTAVLLLVLTLTVTMDLTVAVIAGFLVASLMLIKRLSDTTEVRLLEDQVSGEDRMNGKRSLNIPGVIVYKMFGALFFGAVDKLEFALKRIYPDKKVVILQMHTVVDMDATGLFALERFHRWLQSHGRHLILCGAHTQPYMVMEQGNFYEKLGRENVVATMEEAARRSQILLSAVKE